MSTIRRATPADAPALSAVGRETFADTFGHLYRAEDLAAFLDKSHSVAVYERLLADPSYGLWLAEGCEGLTPGYCVAGPCALPVPDMPPGSGELARLYLRKSAQGSGLGSRLLEEALDWLDAHFEHVYLSVYSENFGAQRLYARYGFVKVWDYFYMVGDHADPEWIMHRRR